MKLAHFLKIIKEHPTEIDKYNIYLFFAEQANEYIIQGSITRALKIGLKFSEFATDSEKAITLIGGKIIAIGTIDHVIHTIKEGFLTGYVTIKTQHTSLIIYYQMNFCWPCKIKLF